MSDPQTLDTTAERESSDCTWPLFILWLGTVPPNCQCWTVAVIAFMFCLWLSLQFAETFKTYGISREANSPVLAVEVAPSGQSHMHEISKLIKGNLTDITRLSEMSDHKTIKEVSVSGTPQDISTAVLFTLAWIFLPARNSRMELSAARSHIHNQWYLNRCQVCSHLREESCHQIHARVNGP